MAPSAPPSLLPVLTVRQGREKPILNRHPWVFSGAAYSEPDVEPGSIVDVRDSKGRFLARGYYNAASKIRARLLTWDENETIDNAFWRRRVAAAIARRRALLGSSEANNACRLVMSEADQLPGLIVDQYGDHLVLMALTAGIEKHLGSVVQALVDEVNPAGIVERSDDAVRTLEGLEMRTGMLTGTKPPAEGVWIRENGLRYLIDLTAGHKTGFYLDQRTNHALVGQLAQGRRVLDCFAYTGGFAVNACQGGAASVLSIDASQAASDRTRVNLAANGFTDEARFRQETGDAFAVLRRLKDQGEQFDLIILDPPKFAATGAQVDKAARGYKDINLLAFRMLAPGGHLATFSCSGHISPDLFQKIVFGASADAGRDAVIERYLYQAEDHPMLLSFPESLYLKGLLCRAF